MSIQLIHAAFTRAISDVRLAADELSTSRLRIDRRISGFLGVDWRGDAAESFVEPWGDWVDGARRATAGLESMADLMIAARRDVVREDEASQEALDAIAARVLERLGDG